MRNAIRIFIGGMAAVALTMALATAGAQAASPPSTPVHLSSSQVARALFVAGDVGRLSQIPSGTEAIVLEKVLQQLYTANPALAPATAVSDIQALQAALTGQSSLTPAALTVMTGNGRILAILGGLAASSPPPDVAHALAQVTDEALSGASDAMALTGKAFDPAADALDTLSYEAFSPADVLLQTETLAASNDLFGQARDALWRQASGESVSDTTKTLLGENPALNNSAIAAFTAMLNPDGSLDTTVGALETFINGGITRINDQNCTLAAGSAGGSAADCTSGALADAQFVAAQCPSGTASTGSGCTAARNQAATDATGELSTIAAARAANAAAADALGLADGQLQTAENADAQAAAQVADEENQYLDYQSTQQYVKAGFDVATEVVTLAQSEIDPVAAFTGLLNIVGDALGFGFSGPDPNMIILQGIQNVSQQISDFENYTQSAFNVLDGQLSSLTSQVALDTLQLSSQLTQAQGQISQLASLTTRLQDSVDHLQSEVQTLFAANANNDLGTLTNTYLGYFQINGTQMSAQQFATAAGALYQDATGTALSPTVLSPPNGFDSLSADSLVTSTDPVLLDSNINYFNYFPTQVTDSGVTWPGDLTDTCAAGAAPANGICLPNPDFWASAARAFEQLLSENPQYVTPARLQQLSTIQQEGQLIENALSKLSTNDAGTDPGGTGNRTLDAALNYYHYWGIGQHASSLAPTLAQAIRNEEQSYLDGQKVPGQTFGYAGVDPWGGVNQTPDAATLQQSTSFTSVPPCSTFAGIAGISTSDMNYHLPYIPAADFSFLDPHVLNAVRLGVGHVSTCWIAEFINQQTGGSGPDGIQGNLITALQFNFGSSSGTQVGLIANNAFVSDCTNDGAGNEAREAADNVIGNWAGSNPGSGCTDMSPVIASAILNGTSPLDQALPSYPADVAAAVEGPSANVLSTLQAGIYKDLIGTGSSLTSGSSQSTDVLSAAKRLGGAQAIVDGYISLGLPQAVASDDTLHGLIAGQNSDAFAPADPNLNIWNVVPARTVPDQVLNFYKAAQAAMPGFDPVGLLVSFILGYQDGLQQDIQGHIVPPSTAATQADAQIRTRLAAEFDADTRGALKLTRAGVLATPATTPGSGLLPETDQVIAPTLTRLTEGQITLQDALTNGATLYVGITGSGSGNVSDGAAISCPGTCSHNAAAGRLVTLTATPGAGSLFAGWSGRGCTGTSPTCTLVVTYDQTVTASFVPSGAPATGTAPTTPTTPAGTSVSGTPPAQHVATCTLKATSNKVLVSAPKRKPKKGAPVVKPGTLSLTVKCNQAGKVKLTGTLTQLIGAKPKHGKQKSKAYGLGPVNGTVKAGKPLTLTVKLPAAVVSALAGGANESAAFMVTVSNGAGTARATVKVTTLKGAR